MVEHSSANPKVPGSIPDSVSFIYIKDCLIESSDMARLCIHVFYYVWRIRDVLDLNKKGKRGDDSDLEPVAFRVVYILLVLVRIKEP